MSEPEKIVFIATHGGEDPGAGYLSLAAGQCSPGHGCGGRRGAAGEWRYIWPKGLCRQSYFPGLTPLKQLVENYVANGGKLLC